MDQSDRSLRTLLSVQGAYYLVTNLWALVGTQHFLQYSNPGGDLFQARSFAALCLVLALYFLAGASRAELQRPAAFLGLGSALAIGLVELFQLPQLGWTWLWADLAAEVIFAGFYVNILFFHRHAAPSDAAAVASATMATTSHSAEPETPEDAVMTSLPDEPTDEDSEDANITESSTPDGQATDDHLV